MGKTAAPLPLFSPVVTVEVVSCSLDADATVVTLSSVVEGDTRVTGVSLVFEEMEKFNGAPIVDITRVFGEGSVDVVVFAEEGIGSKETSG